MKTLHSIALMLKRKECIPSRLMRVVGISLVMTLSVLCGAAAPASADMDIEQTLSDGAQRCTIAFDGFAFVTGTLQAQSFFPPGKVADYWGFQYLRDNTPNGNGHNTSFLTNCAFNVLYILSADQFSMLKTLATNQVDQINLYAYKRFPLMKAFRRLLEGDIPTGSSGLSLDAVKAFSGKLYELDGQISFDRAVVYASILKTLDASQEAYLETMKAGGFDVWTVTPEMESAVRERMRGVSLDVSVALMTYSGDLFSWYAGTVDADVYFCPERQGTYFGSFYVKDAPAIGHEGYKIDEQLTASAGQKFLDELATTHLDSLVTGLVDDQRNSLYAGANNIVQIRTDISNLLRSLITAPVLTDKFKAYVLAQVQEKSGAYGELDGEIVYSYAMAFAQVYQSMSSTQKANMAALRKKIMSGVYNGLPFDFAVCTTPFLYSAVIENQSVLDPYISNTDYLFDLASDVPGPPTGVTAAAGNGQATVNFTAPAANGGSPITSFTVTSSPGGITKTGAASPLVVTGLINGTAYTFTVKAANAIGPGPASGPSNSVTPKGLPGAPTGVTATAGNGRATVSFKAPASNGGSPITSYTVISSPGRISKTGPASPIAVTGLRNGTSYTFTVKAANAVGSGPASSPSNTVTLRASVRFTVTAPRGE
jgi:hypothetical protein